VTATWSAPVDLDNCAAEPIHVPGAVQPHGVLLAVTEPDLVLAVTSTNVGAWFPDAPADPLGHPLADVIGAANRDAVDAARAGDWVQRRDDVELWLGGRPLVATLHRSDGLLVVEIEAVDVVEPGAQSIVREAAMALQVASTVVEVAAEAARWIRSLTGFDRVMVYRFDRDWNGEVIAEEKRADLNAFLGLHYPATDIPAQARELYRRNWLRLIPDILYRPVPLAPPVAFDSARPLDLSTSTLRSVSPIHVEYLSNMGVSASMSVSIVVQGELWGLIACHHYSGPHRPDVAARNAAEFLAQLISLRIGEAEGADTRSRTLEQVALADRVADAIQAPDLDAALRAEHGAVLGLARATGMVVVGDDGWIGVGAVPADGLVRQVLLGWPRSSGVLRVDELDLGADEVASGVLAFPLTSDRREAVLWFRPELVRQVDWGGDPHNAKLAAEEGDHVRLSPRKSFDLWRETVRGRSEPWLDSDVAAATRFTRHLTAGLLRRQRQQAELASDLQRVMRPSTLPVVAGWTFDVHDEPAGQGQIGGDWFDVFDAGDGRVVAVVGDVAGHGLRAAAEMAQLRNSLRAYLLDDPSPARALTRLDALMTRVLPGSIATAVCAVIDTAAAEAQIAHAGHVPAILASEGTARFLVTSGEPLLGVRYGARQDRTVPFTPGHSLVLYSDGLVERRTRPIDDGFELLRQAATVQVGAAWLAEQMRGDDVPEDDVSVLVVTRTG
jgi:light-regulated signal transduction histidine kinase (bacteriophytochrome)